jgi:hypothetical protein
MASVPTKSNLISRFVIVTSVLLCACGGPTTTSTKEVRSPDGYWAAIARSQQWSGLGNAYDEAVVYLKRLNTSDSPIQILGFSNQSPTMRLDMRWVDSTHFDVAYAENPGSGDRITIDFQVVKCAGIDISTHHL